MSMNALAPNDASAQGAPDRLQRRPIAALTLRRIAQRVDARTLGPHRGRDGEIIARRISYAVQDIGVVFLESWVTRSACAGLIAEIRAHEAFEIERCVATLVTPQGCDASKFRRKYEDSLRRRSASGALAALFRAARPPRPQESLVRTVPRRVSVARAPRRVRSAVPARVAVPASGADGPPPPPLPVPRCRAPIGGVL